MDRTIADRVRGLKREHGEECRSLGIRRNLSCDCGTDAHNAEIESLARDLDRAPVPGEARGMAEEALRLAESASPGPWHHCCAKGDGCGGGFVWRDQGCERMVDTGARGGEQGDPPLDDHDRADAAFIARARTLLPALARALLAAPVAPVTEGDGWWRVVRLQAGDAIGADGTLIALAPTQELAREIMRALPFPVGCDGHGVRPPLLARLDATRTTAPATGDDTTKETP